MILGMDIGVFLAWILTILSAILCVFFGIYLEYFRKSNKRKEEKDKPKKEEDK